MKTSGYRKTVAVVLTVCMTAALFVFNGLTGEGVCTADDTVKPDSPANVVYESDIGKLADKWRNYSKVFFGLDGKEWFVCGKQDNELVLFCNPDNSYGETDYGEDTGLYETSKIDKTLVQMTGSDSKAFSKSEIGLMKDVSVNLVSDYSRFSESQYQITRKLYTPYPNDTTIRVGKGTDNPFGEIQLSLKDSQLKDLSFWTRAVNGANVYKYQTGTMRQAFKGDSSNLAPVMHLNLSSNSIKPAFASAAEPAKENARIVSTSTSPSPVNTTLTIRYDGEKNVSYGADYSSKKIYVSTVNAAADEYLYVQWSENRVNKVKSIALPDCEGAKGVTFTAEEIGGSGFELNENVKVWTEKKVDNLCYAKEAVRIKEEGPEAVQDLKVTRATNGESDGAISGFDSGIEYEYSNDNLETWTKIPKGTTTLTGLASGEYYVRIAETATHNPGNAQMYKIKDVYDISVDPDTKRVTINENGIETYPDFGTLSIDLSFSKENIPGTFDKLSGLVDRNVTYGFLEKFAYDTSLGGKPEEVSSALKNLSSDLEGVTAEPDVYTKDILGDIDNAEIKKEMNDTVKNVAEAMDSLKSNYYDGMNKRRFELKNFYTGGIADRSETSTVDAALHYFYSSGTESKSLLKSRDYSDKTKGLDFYNDFADFGDALVNAAPNGKYGKDIFSFYDGVSSHAYNFSSQALSGKEKLCNNVFDFYEKGYAVLATAIAYDVTNHRDQLNHIRALEIAMKKAGTSEEKNAVSSLYTRVCGQIAGLYNQNMSVEQVKKEHEKSVTEGKERLKKLKAQYDELKRASSSAADSVKQEKEGYGGEKTVLCYRNQVTYKEAIQITDVNYPYYDEIKHKAAYYFFNCTDEVGRGVMPTPGGHVVLEDHTYTLKGMLPKYANSDRTDADAAAVVSDLDLIAKCSEQRGLSLDKQMEKAFTYTADGRAVSNFSSSKYYSSTLGYLVNGKQTAVRETGKTWDGPVTRKKYVHWSFFRDISCYKDGKTASYRTAAKKYDEVIKCQDWMEDCILSNEVMTGKYVVHFDRADNKGRGGEDGCFMAEGRAGKSRNRISWSKVDGAAGYDVYSAKCGKSLKKVASAKKRSFVRKKLNSKVCYKYKVKAYKVVDGKKKYIETTPLIHVAGVGTGYSNALSVKLNKDYMNLKTGKSGKLTYRITKKSSKKPVIWKGHTDSRIRYMSSDESVAKVTGKGKVVAKNPGSALIYAYTANGAYTSVDVVVSEQ